MVGCIAIVAERDTVAQLRWFLVAPSSRGGGLGRRLIGEAVAFSRDAGYERMILWTVSGLEAAAHLYRAVGFQRTEALPAVRWGVEVVEEKGRARPVMMAARATTARRAAGFDRHGPVWYVYPACRFGISHGERVMTTEVRRVSDSIVCLRRASYQTCSYIVRTSTNPSVRCLRGMRWRLSTARSGSWRDR